MSGVIEVQSEPGGHVLVFIGEVDAPVVQQLQREHDPTDLTVIAVDVGGLSYIDSTALSVLVECALKAAQTHRRLEIRRPTERFHRVMELAGLTHLFART
jgi:anti-anti-sigma factor